MSAMEVEKTTARPEKKVVYTAKAHTTGGRDGGNSRTSDGRLNVKFSVPGKPGNGTNPEQMLGAGWSSCFISAIGFVAAKKKVNLPPDLAIDIEVDLCTSSDGFSLQARLNVNMPGLEREVAQAIVDTAHQMMSRLSWRRGATERLFRICAATARHGFFRVERSGTASNRRSLLISAKSELTKRKREKHD